MSDTFTDRVNFLCSLKVDLDLKGWWNTAVLTLMNCRVRNNKHEEVLEGWSEGQWDLQRSPRNRIFVFFLPHPVSSEESPWVSPLPWGYESREEPPDYSLVLFILGEHTAAQTGQRAVIGGWQLYRVELPGSFWKLAQVSQGKAPGPLLSSARTLAPSNSSAPAFLAWQWPRPLIFHSSFCWLFSWQFGWFINISITV